MSNINFLIKKTLILFFLMMFISHMAIGMFTVPRRKPVIGKSSTYSALKPVLEEEKEKARAINFLEDKEKAINLLMEKEIEAGYLKKFYIYNEKSEKGTFVDRDTLFLSITFSNLLGDTVNEAEGAIAPSKRLIPVSDEYSEETITNAFDLLKKYQEKQSILDDVATMDLKNFTELVNFCDYIDLSKTDMYAILSNELVNRIKKVALNPSRSDFQQLESVHSDFVKTFVISKVVWDIEGTAMIEADTGWHGVDEVMPMSYLGRIGFDMSGFSVHHVRDGCYDLILKKNEVWFLIPNSLIPKDKILKTAHKLSKEAISFKTQGNNQAIKQDGATRQLQCNWDKGMAVIAARGNKNNGIVLDFSNRKKIFGLVLPECSQDINSITMNNDGNFVAAAFDSNENNIVIWDMSGGTDKIIIQKETRDNPVSSIMFTKNTAGSDVLMYCSEKAIYRKNMTTHQWEEFAVFDRSIQRAEMSPNGKVIAIIFDIYTILMSADRGKYLCKRLKNSPSSDKEAIFFSPDNTYFRSLQHRQQLGDIQWVKNAIFNSYVFLGQPFMRLITVSNYLQQSLADAKNVTLRRLIKTYEDLNRTAFSEMHRSMKSTTDAVKEWFHGYLKVLQ